MKDKKEVCLLVIEIPREIRNEIKIRSVVRNVPMRKWVLIAIIEQIKKEEQTK